MEVPYRYVRARLSRAGLLPTTRLARVACYFLALDIVLYVLEKIFAALKLSFGQSLGGWVAFLTFIAAVLFTFLAYRWLKARILWRLRNRLIVTYVFIGVIPALLLLSMGAISIYLFSGQFANFVVTSELSGQLRTMEKVNAAVTSEIAARLSRGEAASSLSLEGLRKNDPTWSHYAVCGWVDGKPLPMCTGTTPFTEPSKLPAQYGEIVRDSKLYLRTGTTLPVGGKKLTVISSEPLDRDVLEKIAASVGEITLYGDSFQTNAGGKGATKGENTITIHTADNRVESGNKELRPTLTAGALSTATGFFDREIYFATPLPVTDWTTGEVSKTGALLRVVTRPSLLYARLFAAMGDFAKGIEYILLAIAIVFAVIELLALIIGTRLTRTVTKAVAELYVATQHINRGDLRHRIPVKSTDQLSTLANSFNSMTASLEQLIEEQKQKQRLENELAIAQEVQAQLFPRQISQLESLEVHGFCRPARTVSGDYYDFVSAAGDKLLLAVGDISGKGISAALLMATIHSAVRAYSMEGVSLVREPMTVGASGGSALMLASSSNGGEWAPSALLGLLNHHLYESTPAEKYATLFLGFYDGLERTFSYSNGGHLPPIVMAADGSVRRLDCGGTVVGLFDAMTYEESSVQLSRGDIFVAYSDGVTEPENDFGEFGEQRLIDLIRENREQPLERISEIVTAAVDDWIGANEQPDDITLVLARVR